MRWLQKKLALSERGTIEFALSCLACAFQNFALMLPVGLVYSFVMFANILYVTDLNMEDSRAVFYLGGCIVIIMLMLLTSWLQYGSTYFATYRESGARRINLAERLRKIPLSFFADKDLADLSASIMKECALLETTQSHFLAPLIGSGIFIFFMSLSLIFINWKMALAAIWVLPVSFLLAALSQKRSKLCRAIFAVLSYLILKLGLATVALTGAILFSSGDLNISTFILFIMTTARLYDPLEISLQNFAAIISAKPEINYINEIYFQPVRTGNKE